MSPTELAYFLVFRIRLQIERSKAKELAIIDVNSYDHYSNEFKSECVSIINKI